MRRRSPRPVFWIGWATAGAGCADVSSSPRAAYVQQVLVDDNRVWLFRDSAQVAAKFADMAADPYDFMRGSAALHFADLARPDPGRRPSRFLTDPSATTVLLFGDPHPENATVCVRGPGPDGRRPAPTLEYVDLDAAGFGPWTLDLRRAALGLAVMAEALPGCGDACVDAALAAMVDGYTSGLVPPASPDSPPKWGDFVADLLDESLEEGAQRKKLDKYAPVGGAGVRALAFGADTALEPLTAAEARVLDQLVASMPLPEGFRRLDAARRFGSGVSSRAALRYVVLWDTGGPGPDDDGLLQIREVLDPPALPGRAVPRTGVFASNHDRVVVAAERLWTHPAADPLVAGTEVDGLSFKTMSWTSYFQDVEHGKVAEAWQEDDLSSDDLADLGRDLGRVLGASHARAGTLDGLDAARVITTDLETGGGLDALSEELRAVTATDTARLYADFALFHDLLWREGPLLGAERILDGVEP